MDNMHRHYRVEYSADSGETHVITVRPTRRWQTWPREAMIEVDKETKAVRRLVLKREIPQQGTSTIMFTLVDARVPDETKYQPEGHLTEPFRIFTRTSNPEKRREVLTAWFGPAADCWIITEEKLTEELNSDAK